MRSSLFSLIKLAFKQLIRERRAGEVRILFMALLIAVAVSSAIGTFSARLQGAMRAEAGEFLAADLVLSGSLPATEEQIKIGRGFGLDFASTVEFATMLSSDEGIELASVKAVDDAYPLKGALRSSKTLYGAEEEGGGPDQGELWLEARLLTALGVTIGEEVDLGFSTLTVSRVLTYEPDRGATLASLTPRAMMHQADLEASGVIQAGSRVHYRALFAGSERDLQAYRALIESTLTPQQRFETLEEGSEEINSALIRAEQYLNLASLAAILLAAVAIALSANHFASIRLDHAALLRCLGMSRRQTLLLFLLQLLFLALIAGGIGLLLGIFIQALLFTFLKGVISGALPPLYYLPLFSSLLTGMITLFGFALPPLLALGRVPPIRVLRSTALPKPLKGWFIYLFSFGVLALLMERLSLDWHLTLALLGGGVVAALLLGGLIFLLLRTLRALLAEQDVAWRLGLGELLRYPISAVGQILAFGLILFSIALIALLRSELINHWEAQLPEDAPNLFAINIQPHEGERFSDYLYQMGESDPILYPMLPARLSAVNGVKMSEREQLGEGRAPRRDLNVTWMEHFPKANRLVEGSWWSEPPAEPQISVDVEFAQRLGLELGDRLTFTFGAIEKEAMISSLRRVDWNSMQPNFFIIFSPESIETLPFTWITSFHLAKEAQFELSALNEVFPSVTLLQVDALLAQLRQILGQVTFAIEFILLFVLAAGMTVLFAGLQATLPQRNHQAALLRALGANRVLLRRMRRYEFLLMGGISGGIAWIATELSSWILYRKLFDLPWSPHLSLLLLPIIGGGLILFAGRMGTNRALNRSPISILR